MSTLIDGYSPNYGKVIFSGLGLNMEVKYVSDNSTILEKMLRQICLFWGGGNKK